ncbi:PilZ domain-containing protein [Thermospira aquatica]|uniref:PilZ domain-containing protein n=1 Tax=Thermospira aquatica TaxID=2828656 RepID=A0AAX3BAR1_9SPIR|nr:PilZ domain-containing protein [Thermospira aquatica]URA09359.1 PilZ domain-containing protein [Thermospira aquatica]
MDKEISQKNEIINLYNHVRIKRIGVMLQENKNKFHLTGFVTRVDMSVVNLFFDKEPAILPIQNVILSFEYNKNFYYSAPTTVRLYNFQLRSIEVLIPERIWYHPVRRYNRYSLKEPGKVKVYIKKIETKLQETTQVNISELPENLRVIYLALKEENPDLKKILGMVGEEIKRFSPQFKINIFKNLDQISPLERVVYTYKKPFWISDTENIPNYLHIGEKFGVIGYEKYFEMIKKKMAPDILDKIRQTYMSRGILSYLLIPILIGDKVMGAIEITVPRESGKKELSIYDVFYIRSLADIIAEVLVKSYAAAPEGKSEELELVDISLGGISVVNKNMYLMHTIKENSILKLGIQYENTELEVRTRVIRMNYIPGENAGIHMAMEFVGLEEEGKQLLNKIIRESEKAV